MGTHAMEYVDTPNHRNMNHRKKPIQMLWRVAGLLLSKQGRAAGLVTQSYNRISDGYNEAWTSHMRNLTADMIDRMDIGAGQKALDLTCGTGYATHLIAQKTGRTVIGVDASEGMLHQAVSNYSSRCTFVCADILDYLKTIPDESFDCAACCWGLGYSKPLRVLGEVRRILKKGGRVGIIDNTLFSLREVLWASMLAFMEQPDKLEHIMPFRFLTGRRHLWAWYRLSGLRPVCLWSGKKSYAVGSGKEAIARLQATGAAAGFEYAAKESDAEVIFERFAAIIEQRYSRDGTIPIIHRYLAGVAKK